MSAFCLRVQLDPKACLADTAVCVKEGFPWAGCDQAGQGAAAATEKKLVTGFRA